MPEDSRRRLVQLVRRPDADLAEAGLLVAVEALGPDGQPRGTEHVDRNLLRIDAIADSLRTGGVHPSGDPATDAAALAKALAAERGFRGHGDDDRVPEDALLDRVLDRRRGLPVTLSFLYVALARRLRIDAFAIALPGHVVVGLGDGPRLTVIDPFHHGIALDEAALAQRVASATGGQLSFRRSLLRPASPAGLVRRLLNNLTRDYTLLGEVRQALWTVDLKRLLPNRVEDDERVRGRLLEQLGRYDESADAYERYIDEVGLTGPDVAEVRRDAIRVRARLN